MEAMANQARRSTMGELAEFLMVMGSNAVKRERFSLEAGRADALAQHLERQLPKEQPPAIFRRLGRHTQLVLQFGN